VTSHLLSHETKVLIILGVIGLESVSGTEKGIHNFEISVIEFLFGSIFCIVHYTQIQGLTQNSRERDEFNNTQMDLPMSHQTIKIIEFCGPDVVYVTNGFREFGLGDEKYCNNFDFSSSGISTHPLS
jgi:hypothetical protein